MFRNVSSLRTIKFPVMENFRFLNNRTRKSFASQFAICCFEKRDYERQVYEHLTIRNSFMSNFRSRASKEKKPSTVNVIML